ncbi:unnamed protein product [Owenia fusiformis]|uniref:Exostosin GT47 domain-containing protein n=1 Tax=Owenia fusiformis TaxID=6347 RepID=A0A8J1TG44_OWEFU|nr:unnamed protein product [Owenia fusiformis]
MKLEHKKTFILITAAWTVILIGVFHHQHTKGTSINKNTSRRTIVKYNQTIQTNIPGIKSSIQHQMTNKKEVISKLNGKHDINSQSQETKIYETFRSNKTNKGEKENRNISVSITERTKIIKRHKIHVNDTKVLQRVEHFQHIDITNLRVFVYELDPKLNLDAVECLNKRPKNYTHGVACHYDENLGYGRANGELARGVKTFRQCQHGIEVIFHNKLLKSPFRTENPDDADLFFVPYYASLICFCQENVKHSDTAIWKVLKVSKPYIQKKPHFFAIGVPQGDLFSNPKWTPHCHFLRNRPHLDFVKYAHIESSPLLKDGVDIPRESYIHFDTPDVELPRINKDILVFMAGKTLGKSLRKILIRQLTDKRANNSRKNGTYFDMTRGKKSCSDSASKDMFKCLLKTAQRSIFCLQPPGDTPTRKSFYDMLLTGCIPVIFTPHPSYFYPFQNLIKYNYPFNYDKFTIFIKEKRITKRGENIIDILSKIPKHKIRSMQEHLKMIAKYFQYGTYGNGEDAFTMSLRTILTAFHIEGKFLKKQT